MASLAHLFASRDRVFYELFAKLAGTAVKAAEQLVELLDHYPENSEELTAAIRALEHDGDDQLHNIRERLNQTFVTPIDREDILELGSALDDVIDFTEETSDYLILYGIEAPMEQSQKLARILLDATRQIELAVPSIRDFSDVSPFTHEIHRLENEGDRTSRDAIASLFRDGIDPMVVIRWKDIFESLEAAVDACETAANVLEGIGIKTR